jgi:transcriptional regulator with XRE-family HTH domain
MNFCWLNELMAVDRSQFVVEDREKRLDEIANRLRQAREAIGVTQTEFASQISISRDRLASYEDGRAVLRCDVALRACRQFFISEFWLAHGSVNELQFKAGKKTDFSSDLDARLTMALAVELAALLCPPGCTFADGFDLHLRRAYSMRAAEQKGFPRIQLLPGQGPEYFINALSCMMAFWQRGLSQGQWGPFFASLVLNGQSTHRRVVEGKFKFAGLPTTHFLVEDPSSEILQPSPKKQGPKDNFVPRNDEGVQKQSEYFVPRNESSMEILLGRVSKAVAARGKKAALAKFLNVSPSRVSDWLHGNGEPTGKITLRLLEWVTAEEAEQNKSRGIAETPPRRKAH